MGCWFGIGLSPHRSKLPSLVESKSCWEKVPPMDLQMICFSQYQYTFNFLSYKHIYMGCFPVPYWMTRGDDLTLASPGSSIVYFGGHRHNVDQRTVASISPHTSWLSGGGGGGMNMDDWLVVWKFYIFPYIGLLIIPIDELMFFRGVAQPPTRWKSADHGGVECLRTLLGDV